MSYEGYDQRLCVNGHLWDVDAMLGFYLEDDQETCPYCNAKVVWWNQVNETNGSFDDDGNRIDGFVELEVKTPVVHCTCTCGNTHVKEQATYHLPPEGVGCHGKLPTGNAWSTD